jgi:hypothetical protein
MEENNTTQKQENIQINIDNTDDAIGWLERFLELLNKYGFWKILGATVGIIIVSVMLYFAFNWEKGFEVYDAWKTRQHTADMEQRMEVGPKIQSVIDKLTYKINASRVVILELHNGNTGGGGLPFTKCSATYESLNLGVYPVGSQYQDHNMSLMPFAHHLFKTGYWCSDVDELENIDRALYYKMKGNDTEHFSACVIEGVDNKPIAFMIVSFDKKLVDLEHHECHNVRDDMRHVAMELAVFLEVKRILNDK